MSSCRVITCEKTSRLAAALRSALDGHHPPMVETRSLTACEAALREAPASLVVIETTAVNVESVVDLFLRGGRQFANASFAALIEPGLESAAPLLRQAGAVDVICSLLEAPRLARLARRQLALAPKQAISFDEFVAERMPWRAYATTES